MDSDCPSAVRPECEAKFDHVRDTLEQRIDRLREVLTVRLDNSDRALEIQAREYERRLDALNGEQARLAADRAHSVSRDLFDNTMTEWRLWREGVEKRMSQHQGTEKGISIVWAALIGIVPTAIAIAALLR